MVRNMVVQLYALVLKYAVSITCSRWKNEDGPAEDMVKNTKNSSFPLTSKAAFDILTLNWASGRG